MIFNFLSASVQVEEVRANIKVSTESVEDSRSGDASVVALKRSSESCEKGNICITAKHAL